MGRIPNKELENNITVSALTKTHHRRITTKNKFFKLGESYIYKDMEDYIIFTRPTLDYKGNTIKPSLTNKKTSKTKWFSFIIISDISFGIHEIDENSTEDELIIYYNE